MLIQQVVSDSSRIDERAPTLRLSLSAWQQLQTYVALCPAEINGFAYVEHVAPGIFAVKVADDVFITRQTVSGHSAVVDPVDYGLATAKAVTVGRESEMRLQWHSHVYTGAYHSSTDLGSIQGFEDFGMEWFISLVTNKFGDVTARLDTFKPFRLGASMKIVLVHEVPDDHADKAQALIDQLVTIEKAKKRGAA